MSIIIGIDHGYYAIKTAHCSFPAGLTSYGEHEPYTRQGLLEFGGCFFVCGSGRQPIQRDKTVNDNYYLLTLAAIAKEIQQRGLPPECSVRIAAGLPLTSFGRDKPKFREYLLRSKQPVNYKFEGVEYSITIEEVAVFPQGYAALMTETGLLQDEPSMLLMDLGGWTVDLMRIDNAIPVADTAHSLELGMIRCVDEIREQVRRETGLSLTDAQIENMLAGHPCTVSEAVRGIVNQQGRKYTEHLLSATMEAGFDLHAIPAVLLGGGASVVSRHLSPKDGLCKTIFLLDDFSSILVIMPLYIQTDRGYSATMSGLIMLPGAIGQCVSQFFGGRAMDRFGARPVALFGSIVLTLGTLGMSLVAMDTWIWWVSICQFIRQIGMGFLLMPITTWSLNCLNGPSEVSAGSSVTNTARQIAGAVGAPVLVILMETFAALHKQGGASAVAASIFGIQWALRISAMICLAMVLMVFFGVKGDGAGRTRDIISLRALRERRARRMAAN